MKLSDFDYRLPQELIAQYPLKERDGSRMMVLERAQKRIYESSFKDIVEYLNKGDTMVLNNAKVIPARLLGKKETGPVRCCSADTNRREVSNGAGAKIELFLLENLGDGIYKVLAKPSKRLKTGAKVLFRGGLEATVLKNADFGKIVRFEGADDMDEKLKTIGQMPLPPYIKRNPEKSDEERYQTVYAESDGATASPTAGLHFTDGIINEIKNKYVNIAYVTLNVSYGTFAPVLEEEIKNHKMHKEYFKLPEVTAEIINETKKRGDKVVAVGTTAARVLETCAVNGMGGRLIDPAEGYADLFIYPGYKFKVVDALLTNFHIPKSTLLMLVSAFAGREFILEAYKKAIEAKFRFFSYGDCMLIL